MTITSIGIDVWTNDGKFTEAYIRDSASMS